VGHFRGSENPVRPARPCRSGMKRHLIELVRPKIKLGKVENFQRSNKLHLRTTIHHTITTNPPANYQQKTRDFSEPPSKTPAKQPKLATQPTRFFLSNSKPKNHLPTKSKIKII
jgi:hypothetical protein